MLFKKNFFLAYSENGDVEDEKILPEFARESEKVKNIKKELNISLGWTAPIIKQSVSISLSLLGHY